MAVGCYAIARHDTLYIYMVKCSPSSLDTPHWDLALFHLTGQVLEVLANDLLLLWVLELLPIGLGVA